jgi:hypothetical protein
MMRKKGLPDRGSTVIFTFVREPRAATPLRSPQAGPCCGPSRSARPVRGRTARRPRTRRTTATQNPVPIASTRMVAHGAQRSDADCAREAARAGRTIRSGISARAGGALRPALRARAEEIQSWGLDRRQERAKRFGARPRRADRSRPDARAAIQSAVAADAAFFCARGRKNCFFLLTSVRKKVDSGLVTATM